MFAGALQSLGRARVFGRQTMGQALPALTKTLPNGDVLLYAVGDFVTSTGRRLEGAGVMPDEQLPLSIAGAGLRPREPISTPPCAGLTAAHRSRVREGPK